MQVLKKLVAIVIGLVIAFMLAVKVCPASITKYLIDAKRMVGGLETHSVQLADGSRMPYLRSKPSDKPIMLLVHGFTADKDNFNEVAPYLRDDYQLIIPDLVGFGEATKLATADYTTQTQAKRLQAFMDKIGVKQPVYVAGSSMGGNIAIKYTALYPAQVKALWLLAPSGVSTGPVSEMRQIIAQTGKNPLIVTQPDDLKKIVAFVMSKPPFAPDFVLEVMGKQRLKNAALEQIEANTLANEAGVEPLLPSIKTPTLIVWGAQDRLLHPAGAQILHKGLSNSKVIVMDGIGHLPHMEAPRQVASDIKLFIQTLPSP